MSEVFDIILTTGTSSLCERSSFSPEEPKERAPLVLPGADESVTKSCIAPCLTVAHQSRCVVRCDVIFLQPHTRQLSSSLFSPKRIFLLQLCIFYSSPEFRVPKTTRRTILAAQIASDRHKMTVHNAHVGRIPNRTTAS